MSTKINVKSMKDEFAIDQHVGDRLRSVRLVNKVTQTQLADAVGLTFQQIQKYEKGTNRIGASRMAQFCEIFGVDPNYFFHGLGITKNRKPSAVVTDPQAVAVIGHMKAIKSAGVRRRVVGFVETVSHEFGGGTRGAA